MHLLILEEVVLVSRRRIAEGDNSTVEPFSVELLEEAIVELANMLKRERIRKINLPNGEWLVRKLAGTSDLEPQAGLELT